MKESPVADLSTIRDHSHSRIEGPAIRTGVEALDRKVLPVASAPLNYEKWPNKEFNRQMDLYLLDMGQLCDHATFPNMPPENAEYRCGEGSVHAAAKLKCSPGWNVHEASCQGVTDDTASPGTGQTNVIFPFC